MFSPLTFPLIKRLFPNVFSEGSTQGHNIPPGGLVSGSRSPAQMACVRGFFARKKSAAFRKSTLPFPSLHGQWPPRLLALAKAVQNSREDRQAPGGSTTLCCH